jgi:hypothetical protein
VPQGAAALVGQIAQLVEHSTENAGVASSTLALPTSPSSSATVRAALLAGAVAAGLTWALAAAWRPMPLVHAATWLVTGLVGLPLLFAAALSAVAAALSALLTALALPHLLLRRPTGLGDACAAVWALPRGILPGYLAALRRVRQPGLWGAAAGFVLGAAAFVAVHGFRPAAG